MGTLEMRKWWQSCGHRWEEIGRTRIPPVVKLSEEKDGQLEIRATGYSMDRLLDAMKEHTAILLRCQYCGDVKTTEVPGWFPE